jgi:hypothetical protein
VSCTRYVWSILAKSFLLQVIYIDSDDDDNVEILPPQPTQIRSNTSGKTTHDELNGERMPRKRAKHTRGDTNLQVSALPDVSDNPTKASEDEPNGRRKPSPRTKVARRELIDHMDIEKGWLASSLLRSHKISKLFKTQNRLMTDL